MARRLVLSIVVVVGLTACVSPESTRTRGGGPGADTGNTAGPVLMHEGSDPYFGTERLIGSYGQVDLHAARHADRASTP